MLCDDCQKRNAVIHMTKVIQGKKEEVHLCEVCAKARENKQYAMDFSIQNFLANLLDSNINTQFNLPNYQPLQCPRCGTTFSTFKQTGRLGCDLCYDVFYNHIHPLVRRIHGTANHVGKLPKSAGGTIHLKRELKLLKNQLQEAVEKEAYEEAAALRDQIRQIENQLKEA
ncbi:UvrB/UvrC motif-containing protein [Alkaliphilus crotonatoxidans]